jgi:protein phosphatase 2C family protein 2/3
MGNVNSANLLTKTSKYKNDQLICSFACAQGRRDSMEDNYVLGRFHENTESESQYLAVFDGHAGKECALLAADHSVQMLKQRQNQLPKDEKEWQTLMLQLDQYLRDKLPPNDQSGTTFNGLLVTQGNANEYFIQCINVGDSRSVMCTIDENNEIKKVEDLSTDHKPNTPLENLRIVNAGGFVTGNRVNGNLALSRALGDFGFKNNSGL